MLRTEPEAAHVKIENAVFAASSEMSFLNFPWTWDAEFEILRIACSIS